jgi:copper transport protein
VRRRRNLLAALALALGVAAALTPAAAQAHAVLERTAPERGAALAAQPVRVAFFFNEPVESELASLRVFDSSGNEVQSGPVLRPAGSGSAVAVALEPNLPDGGYTATYRLISADSHPVSGGFVFSIGKPDAGGAPLSELLADQSGLGTDSAALVAIRWVGYASTAIVVGCLLFLLIVWAPAGARLQGLEGAAATDRAERRMRGLLLIAAAAGLLAALLTFPLQAATAAGVPLGKGFDADLIADVAGTRIGTLALIRLAAWVAVLGLLLLAGRGAASRPRPAAAILAIPLAALIIVPGLGGHAYTQSPSLLLLPADFVHVAAMCVWAGGLVALVAVLPAATTALPPRDRGALLSDCLSRFSPLALGAVIALAVTGTIQAVVEVGSFPALIETAFGRTVLVKVALFAVLIALGWHNRNRLLPAIRAIARAAEGLGRTGRRLRDNLRAEVFAVAAILIASAMLIGYPPASESGGGPVSGSTTVGGAYLEYTVEPAEVGRNEVHLYLFDSEDGSQLDPRQVTATASLPDRDVGPLPIELRKAGPGHYVAPAAPFGIAGDWDLALAIRTSRFDQDETAIDVSIR